MSAANFISRTLYSLKKRYPATIVIYWLVSNTTNRETGVKTKVMDNITVTKAIKLPEKTQGYMFQELLNAVTAASLKSGGTIVRSDVSFIIDYKDIKIDLKEDMWIVHDNKKYEIVDIQEFEQNKGYIVRCRLTDGQSFNQVYKQSVYSRISYAQTLA